MMMAAKGGQRVGYIRVSSVDQNEARQVEALSALSIDKTFIDKASGKDTARPQLQAALTQGRQSTDPAVRAKAYQTVNKRFAIDLPYLWTDRAVWSVESTLKVQNWNNPTTPTGAPAYGMIGGSIWPTQIWLS